MAELSELLIGLDRLVTDAQTSAAAISRQETAQLDDNLSRLAHTVLHLAEHVRDLAIEVDRISSEPI